MFHVKQKKMLKTDSVPGQCLLCEGSNFLDFLELKDYFLSQEKFKLARCQSCGLLYSSPRPTPDSIQAYYNSDEYISHNTKQRSLKNLLYRQARKKALRWKLNIINRYVREGRILDIGAGTGEFLNYCRKHGWEAMGVEPNASAREKAFVDYGLKVQDANDFSMIGNASVDVISMWHVLEHMEDPLEQFYLNYRLLKKDGLLVLALPNYESWDANHYGRYWAAYDVPRHLFHFTKESVKRLSDKTGFRIEGIQALKLDAYYISLLSEKYAHGKMNYLKAFLNGWRSNRAAKMGKFGYSSWVYLIKKK